MATGRSPSATRRIRRPGARSAVTSHARAVPGRNTSTATANSPEVCSRVLPAIVGDTAPEAFKVRPIAKLTLLFSEQLHRELPAKRAVALEMPFATHGVPTACAALGVKQDPRSAACRTRASAAVVLGQAPGNVIRPADISEMAAGRKGTENIDVAVHASNARDAAGILTEAAERTRGNNRLSAGEQTIVARWRGRVSGTNFRLCRPRLLGARRLCFGGLLGRCRGCCRGRPGSRCRRFRGFARPGRGCG